MTDDNTGLPLGGGYLTCCTSAGNALYFATPASRDAYVQLNGAQFNKGLPYSTAPDGDYSQGNQAGLP